MLYDTLMILGSSSSELQLPVSHAVTRVNNRYTYNHSVPIQSFCFSLSEEYSINYLRYSILDYKTVFVLGDFAQL